MNPSPDVASIVQIIQTLLSPVLMISACGLILLTMQNRYGRLNDRLRELSRERMELLGIKTQAAMVCKNAIDRQMPDLLKRNKLLRNSLVSIFSAVLCLIFVIFFIALALFWPPHISVYLSVGVFVLAQVLIFFGISFMVREAFISHRAVEYETHKMLELDRIEGQSKES